MNICKPPDKNYIYVCLESTNEKSNICTFLCVEIYTFTRMFVIILSAMSEMD